MDENKHRAPKVWLTIYLVAVAFALFGSLAARFSQVDTFWIQAIVSFVILVSGAIWTALRLTSWIAVAAVLALAGGAEFVGMTTGFPFGRYIYTGNWFPSVPLGGGLTYPLSVPVAWLLIVGSVWLAWGEVTKGWKRVVLVALSAAIVDAGLEDLMVHGLGYWTWLDKGPVFGAPLLNTFGWVLVAGIGATLLERMAPDVRDKGGALVLGAYSMLMGELALLRGRPSTVLWFALAAIFCFSYSYLAKARRT